MGEHELQEALREEAQARIRELWRAAEAAVARRRAETEEGLAALRGEAARREATAVAAVCRTVLTATRAEERRQRLAGEAQFEQRLHALAVRLLPELCATERCRLWQALANELPAAEWQRVRVHPDDLLQAQRTFPAAEVTADSALGGGLVAETADGRIVVDNSLAGRLEQSWPALLTPLLAAADEELDKDAAGSAAPG